MKVSKAKGEGQGSCTRCELKGKWNRSWMCFLYRIEGIGGLYCSDCIKEIKKEIILKRLYTFIIILGIISVIISMFIIWKSI